MDSTKQTFDPTAEPTAQQRIESAVTQRNPAWWTGRHLSAWERVKEAFHRDWEQTKADFSSSLAPDRQQADIDRERAEIAESTRRVTEALAAKQVEAHDEMLAQQAQADEEMVRQRAELAEELAQQRIRLEDELAEQRAMAAQVYPDGEPPNEAWDRAEREASYGFAARTEYPQFTEWTPALEGTLRGEWAEMKTGRAWEEALPGVRRGWEFAKPTSH